MAIIKIIFEPKEHIFSAFWLRSSVDSVLISLSLVSRQLSAMSIKYLFQAVD